jgi:hypothetical protein
MGGLPGTAGGRPSQASQGAASFGAVGRAIDSAGSFVTERPLLCAAIAVAIGTALVSLLPSAKTEDRDAVRGTASQVGSDRAQAAVEEDGLSSSALAEAASRLGEGIREGAQGGASQPMTETGPREAASGSSRS